MASEADITTYLEVATRTQAGRNDLIHLLSHQQMATIVTGSFVRVLLELANGTEDYFVGRVTGLEAGAQYSGFSQNANQATTVYLQLLLPDEAAGNTSATTGGATGGLNNLYQLNSISNSPFSRREIAMWLGGTPADQRPNTEEVNALGRRLREAVPPRGPRRGATNRNIGGAASANNNNAAASAASAGGGGGTSPTGHPPPHPSSGGGARGVATPSALGGRGSASPVPLTTNTRNGGTGGVDGPANLNSTQAAGDADAGPASPSRSAGRSAAKLESSVPTDPKAVVYQKIVKEKNNESTLFKRKLDGLATNELRTLERDVGEYLDRVREVIANKRDKCVVCLDQYPSVIIMPCRHRVLCKWCALKVQNCPMCRGLAVELFEPLEL